jgi:hypothetical protein
LRRIVIVEFQNSQIRRSPISCVINSLNQEPRSLHVCSGLHSLWSNQTGPLMHCLILICTVYSGLFSDANIVCSTVEVGDMLNTFLCVTHILGM